jgi:hypothetical protein
MANFDDAVGCCDRQDSVLSQASGSYFKDAQEFFQTA